MKQALSIHFLYYAVLGLVVGTLSALLGIGGGVIMVPILHLLFGKNMQVAIGTSLGAMVFGALAGAARHASYGNIDWLLAAGMGVGAIAGAYAIGAPLAEALPSDVLRKMFGVLMLVFGLRMMGVFAWVASLVAR